jgi:hypothetical protein
MYNNIKKMFADSSLKTDIKNDKREIRIAIDSNSAVAPEQMFLKPYGFHVISLCDISTNLET